MFNTSLRRVARPSSVSANLSRPTTQHSVSASFSSHTHQRRHSSSKPPVPPNDGSSAIPASQVKQVGAPRTDKRVGADTRLSKRKAPRDKAPDVALKEDEWTKMLPSVPSTQHLNPKDIYVASFFSTHRPISITGPIPQETQLNDFDKVFAPRPKSKSRAATAEVIYTLSSTVENLDDKIATARSEHNDQAAVAQRADIIKQLTQHNNEAQNPGEPHHLDGLPRSGTVHVNGSNIKLLVQQVARHFRPFNVPPPPVPVPELDFEVPAPAQNAATEAQEEMQAKQLEVEIENQDQAPEVLNVILRPHASKQASSQQTDFFTSHRAPAPVENPIEGSLHEISSPSSIPTPRSGGRIRRGGYIITNAPRVKKYGDGMLAISVKRQRKLKMKKHKYKKLMRKTRNLRRRQDKL